ncbi:MAG: hypothetical protein IPK00_05080 [Deltaproteobacteria bacterium]|nr:hypothetical protein [Deltaproteobacteria bacterium]
MGFTAIRWPARTLETGRSIALVAVLLAACAHDAEPPRWIEHPGRGWPAARFVTGVGQGENPEAAATAARAEIARKTKGEHEGIEIARTWVAKKPRIHWALAVLDRPALIARLGDQIAENDRARTAAAERAEAEAPETAVLTLLEAIDLSREREGLRVRIARLEGTPPTSDVPPSRADLDLQLAGVKRTLTIAVAAFEMDPDSGEIGAPLDAVRRALAQQVLAKGFSLPVEGEWGESPPAWLRVLTRIGFEHLELGGSQGFATVEWEAALEVFDPSAGGRVVALLDGGARATHVNEKTARRLAREEAIEFVTTTLASWLDGRYARGPR